MTDAGHLKEEIVTYWSGRAEQFACLRRDELNSRMRPLWLAELRRCLPEKRPLDVLDIGTGTGFFCFLLEADGCRVTGIDLSPQMIDGARACAQEISSRAVFCVMDAESPVFAPGTFDAIVTRNLTCFLPDLPRAYRNWYGLLRDGGVLVNFDGDYIYDEQKRRLPAQHSHQDLTAAQNAAYEHIRVEMKTAQKPRPAWDMDLLSAAGFSSVTVDHGVSERVYREFDRFYNPVPVFAIVGRRQA